MGSFMTRAFSRENTETATFEDIAELIRNSKYCIALTGAGVSAESGIPTFRDTSSGLWRRYDPMTYGTIWGFKKHPEKIWELLSDVQKEVNPKPNPSHYALAELERMGYLRSIITQNIDNLHQDAGSKHVIEFHGSIMRSVCMKCHTLTDLNRDMFDSHNAKYPPPCTVKTCTGVVKPNAVLFGESIPRDAVVQAGAETKKCDLLLVIGTSANVTPASDIPYSAKSNGAKVIEINLEKTGLCNKVTNYFVQGKSSSLMRTVEILRSS